MQSTLTPQDADPHDAFVIEPDVVLATRQASPDPVQELLSHLAHKAAKRSPEVPAAVPTPMVETPKVDTPTPDTTFRAIDKIDTTDRPVVPDDRPGISWWVKRAFIAFMFALCSAFAAAAWTHHGAAARQMVSSWLPPFVLAASPGFLLSGPAGLSNADGVVGVTLVLYLLVVRRSGLRKWERLIEEAQVGNVLIGADQRVLAEDIAREHGDRIPDHAITRELVPDDLDAVDRGGLALGQHPP